MAEKIFTAFLNQEDQGSKIKRSSVSSLDAFSNADFTELFNNHKKSKKYNKKMNRRERNANISDLKRMSESDSDEETDENANDEIVKENAFMKFFNFCKENPETVIDYTYKAIGIISAAYTAYSMINGKGGPKGGRRPRFSRRGNRGATDFFNPARK